ncbi:LysE family translocator [Roseomonas sp. CECT 9278]|uniref:LysE family translocator n=1 Tax=Roseomonas sp. CECT 9278 TaxID=2845823 RepID=UPI001E64FD27|nr:LysE family translocator [Roseomonas sp. CECT 9278]CAH0299099.1 Cysteine/O-acetylserine efflux protein [Roseomonas sp. CECT 9278]
MDKTLALLGFAIAMSVTPGPNVLMVAAGAANAGIRATVPHMLGITIGFAAMLLIVGLGLAGPFAAMPMLHTALKWGGAAWLLVLAWKIARAGAPGEGPPRPPLGFIGAALFQWVNPKAWMIALAAIPAFTTPDGDILAETLLIAGAFALVCFPCCLVWAALGAGASRLLRTDRALRGFNIAMAVLLVLSLIPALT